MCGIAGAWSTGGVAPHVLAAMTACVAHRGPDASGTWHDPRSGVALGHQRLAVLDLSDAGAQPMHSASGRFVLVLNGECYDHLELRRTLTAEGRAPAWRGTSDTETLLAGFEAWGVRGTLERATGMFALAVMDREAGRLTLARDRLGEKPLVYARHVGGGGGATLLFGSQPSVLLAHPGFAPDVDPASLAQFLRHGTVPGARTIRSGVHELPPGHLLEIDSPDALGTPIAWWSLLDVARAGVADPLDISDEEAVDLVERALVTAVARQTIADVPLGAFLSGGIDSSVVVALLRAASDARPRTFTIGSTEADHDESVHARRIAAHLGTHHTELRLTPDDALALVPELAGIHDEPFADQSQLPTLLVSRLARTKVTVALSGDGGDELFGGYERYLRTERLLRVPSLARRTGGAALGVALGLASAAGGVRRSATARRRAVARALRAGDAGLVRHTSSLNPYADGLVLGVDGRAAERAAVAAWGATAGLGTARARMMALDTLGYLPDDVLHKVDRAAMSVALETRVPLLDHHVVALAWRLPARLRGPGRPGKWVLREVLARHVPRELFERPKAGFAVPIGRWLRGPLRGWAEGLLAADALARDGLLDVTRVRSIWAEHLAGGRDAQYELWPVLMFQAWSEQQSEQQAVRARNL
jgi:asparagine synthase (glutamine-hydrolysing)